MCKMESNQVQTRHAPPDIDNSGPADTAGAAAGAAAISARRPACTHGIDGTHGAHASMYAANCSGLATLQKTTSHAVR
jgi:hypothetical protein